LLDSIFEVHLIIMTIHFRFFNRFILGILAPVLSTSVLAQPTITSLTPTANQRNTPRTTAVSVQFNQSLSAGSAAALRVFSNQRGGLRNAGSGTTALSGSTLTFTPTYGFWPGETVMATVTRTAQSSAGNLAQPRVYQFTAAATGGSGTFTGGADVPVGNQPYIVVTADVDNDGDLDLITPNFNSSTVSVRLNNGAGVFSGGADFSVGSQPRGVVMADLDGDGDLDLATSNYNANTVSVRLNNGSGIFSGSTELPVGVIGGSRPQSIVANDVDGDGDLDLLSSNEGGANISVRLNNGNATFSSLADVPVTSFPFAITAGDVDGDGDSDLVAGNYTGSTVSIRFNNGGGTLLGSTNVNVASSPRGVTLADVDADGDLDMLAANAGSNNVSVRLNNGAGLFSGTQNVSVGSFPGSVTTGDVDGDSDLDMLTTNISSNTVSLRLNNGSGIFSGGSDIPVGQEPYRVAVADLDGDGDLDLLAANFRSNTVSVRFNQAPPPRVTIVGDSMVCTGGQVQLTATAPVPITTYRWSTGATTPSIMVALPGTYSVTATFAGGGTSTDQHIVRTITPTIQIAGDTLLCNSSPGTLVAAAANASSFRWNTGATTPAISVTQPGIYTVTAYFGTGCAVTAQQAVRTPTLRITGTTTLCAASPTSTILTAVAPGATAIRWNTGASTTSLTVTQAGAYSVTATFANGCTLTANQVVTVPVAGISGDSVLCGGRPAQLTAGLTGGTATAYLWSTGATSASVSVTQPGIYSVAISYGQGCVGLVQQRVRLGTVLPNATLGSDTTLCEGEQLTLRAPSMMGVNLTYRWSDGSTGPVLRVQQPGTYSLQLITACDTRTLSRRIDFQACLTIPNIITANEDGQNDRFRIKGLPAGTWALQLYNRWGKKVYETAAYQNDWGNLAAPGMYYYVLHRTGNTSYKGWFEVVR
jgi:gliding motility-associated-like protein